MLAFSSLVSSRTLEQHVLHGVLCGGVYMQQRPWSFQHVTKRLNLSLTCPDGGLHSVTVQVPDVITTDTHVLSLTKTQATLAAEGTGRVETLLPSLYIIIL